MMRMNDDDDRSMMMTDDDLDEMTMIDEEGSQVDEDGMQGRGRREVMPVT